MVINKNIWISAATKEPKQNWKIKGLVPGQVKKGRAEEKQSKENTDTVPESWQQDIYIMRLDKMAFCLPSAWIDQEENLSRNCF